MTRLTEEMVIARTRANDLANIRKLNVWGSGLSDVSLLRKMQNVEVLSLSVNKIATLADFQWCRNLQELYVRRNEIRDLNQVCYLRELPRLRSLWLDENPCASCDLYRVTVLRALPHLQKLDNVAVAPEEVQSALRQGLELCHPEDSRAADLQLQQLQQHADSLQHSPARQEEYELGPYYDDYEEPAPIPASTPVRRTAPLIHHQPRSPPRRHPTSAPSDPDSEPEAQQPAGGGGGRRPMLHEDLYYDTDRRNANYESDTTGYGRTINNQYHNNIYDGDEEPAERGEERGEERRPPAQLDLSASRRCSPALAPPSSALLPPPPASRRPVPRVWNSNILSAVLCLIKELDFPSLEVVEVAVRSRMEEF